MDAASTQMVLKIRGMTCSTCEKRVEDAVREVAGVLTAKADQSRGRLALTYDKQATSNARLLEHVRRAVANAGYAVLGPVKDEAKPQTATILVTAAGMIALFLLINSQGWFNFLPTIDSSVSLAMIFVAGLLTSAHCVAMCGGIALTQQAGKPLRGLGYHLGRVVSYTLLGGLVGALGSVVSFSPATKGVLAGIAGVFMVGLGLRMLGLFPQPRWLSRVRLPWRLPTGFLAAFRKKGPFFVGLANGLMPCGPLQTMQLYALGTGNAALGALSMFLFSLGTVPLMFVFGALSSFFTAKWQHRVVKASAVLVVFFGLVMSGRALDLSGASGAIRTLVEGSTSSLGTVPSTAPGTVAVVKNGVQVVGFELQPAGYAPITVQKGIPVEWTIYASSANLNGCNGEIVVPQFNLKKKLAVGANVIQFTPTSVGTVTYSCWMGMISSTIRVVENVSLAQPPLAAAPSSGAGCCALGTATAFAGGRIPTDKVEVAEFKTERGKRYQEVTVTVDDQGYSPAVLVVQKGVPTRIRFVAKALSGCNSYVQFPDYGAGLDLARGQLETPLIPVGPDFVFQCGMGMLHGYVRVVDDLSAVDFAEVRAKAAAWKASAGQGGCCGR